VACVFSLSKITALFVSTETFSRLFWKGRAMRKSGPPKGLISYIVLELLAERPRYGYELLKEITELSGGHWEPSYGSVYPILYKFEEKAWAERIEREDEPDRKYFALTEQAARNWHKSARMPAAVPVTLQTSFSDSTMCTSHSPPTIGSKSTMVLAGVLMKPTPRGLSNR